MEKIKSIPFLFFLFIISNSIAQNNPPISPKWVFEPWVWEDWGNTEASIQTMVNTYRDSLIPLGAVIIDSPWETGYNTFEFDLTSYPDPEGLITDFKDMGIHTILWITGVIDSGTAQYEYAKAMHYFVRDIDNASDWAPCTYFWKGSGRAGHIDFFNSDALDWWKSLMDQIFDNLDVDGWKVDMSDYYVHNLSNTEGKILTAVGEKSLKNYSEAYYREILDYTIQQRGIEKAMITARPYCSYENRTYASIDKNTAGWVGDQVHYWGEEGLLEALNDIFISSYLGYAAVGSDIGGFKGGSVQDRNLFIRWSQLGSLIPIMENGGRNLIQHLPWEFSQKDVTTDIYRYYATLHHQLVPYLYHYDIVAHNDGTSILRPIGSRGTGSDSIKWIGEWTYLLGDDLFVAAIFDSVDYLNRPISFPNNDNWIYYWDESIIIEGGHDTTMYFSLNEYPVFIRSGAIIPMNVDNSITGHGNSNSANKITLLIYPDNNTSLDFNLNPEESILIENYEKNDGDSIYIGACNKDFIIRIKLPYKPHNICKNYGYEILEIDDASEFDECLEGWRYVSDSSHCWIKFLTNGVESNIKINKGFLVINNPLTYELGRLFVGSEYYIDREYVIEKVPTEFLDLPIIKTANNDKTIANLNFNFQINKKSKIYVAYDHRLMVPDWISSEYTFTNKAINVSDVGADSLLVWEKLFDPGLVTMGDNEGISESSMYFVFCEQIPHHNLSCKIYLEGAYSVDSMSTNLLQKEDLPLIQPYNCTPWNYNGNESVEIIPRDVVDWVLIELRNISDNSVVEARRAVFLLKNGEVVDLDGRSPVQFATSNTTFYLVIYHRNHLGIMSSTIVNF